MSRYYPPQSPFQTGLAGKCPRCSQGVLFESYLKLKDKCAACGLDYTKADAGDGPAVFMIFIGGFVSTVVLFVTKFGMGAPAWVALLLSILSMVAIVGVLMQPLKGLMVALQFTQKASQSRLGGDDREWT